MNLMENEKMEIFLNLDQDRDGFLTLDEVEDFKNLLVFGENEEEVFLDEKKRLSFSFDSKENKFISLEFGDNINENLIHSDIIHGFNRKKIQEMRSIYKKIDYEQKGFFSFVTMNKGIKFYHDFNYLCRVEVL